MDIVMIVVGMLTGMTTTIINGACGIGIMQDAELVISKSR